MVRITLIAGLGFGDEGKGTITEYVVGSTGAEMVVRYNGGPQTAHNVVLADGRHHCFSQFGSGTLRGAKTYLSEHVLVDPIALHSEAKHLKEIMGEDPYPYLIIDENAVLITPYHRVANRLREQARSVKHGTCAVGLGEAREDSFRFPSFATARMKDLFHLPRLRDKLATVRERKLAEFGKGADSFLDAPVDDYMPAYEALPPLQITDVGILAMAAEKDDAHLVFEGAQGVLLDENDGFTPHVTWTCTTFHNATKLLCQTLTTEGDIKKIGVLRTYATRHGAGPFPTEKGVAYPERAKLLAKEHNGHGIWQGNFRVGYFDAVSARYALECVGGVDEIALTHLDKTSFLPKYCDEYKIANLWHSAEARTTAIGAAIPVLTNEEVTPGLVQDLLRTRVGILSRGPCLEDKSSVNTHAETYQINKLYG